MAYSHTLSAGAFHTCGAWSSIALTTRAYCWGENTSGALGDGTTMSRMAPGPTAPTLDDVRGITSGGYRVSAGIGFYDYHGHTCANIGTGAVRCWGRNEYGQLGDGSTTDRLSPVDVSGLLNVEQLSAGNRHTCALIADHTLRCWGANEAGQLGNGTYLGSSTPQPVTF
jgi:alpha-tubulin suppressor-like RCC1 family protein